MRMNDDGEQDWELPAEYRKLLLTAMTAEPDAGLARRIVQQTLAAQERRRLHLGQVFLAISAVGFLSPLALLLLAPMQWLFTVTWQVVGAAQPMRLPLGTGGFLLNGATGLSLALLIGAAALTLFGARLARMGG